MCFAQGPQRSDAGETQTRGPSVSSQALYHWVTALPCQQFINKTNETAPSQQIIFNHHIKS